MLNWWTLGPWCLQLQRAFSSSISSCRVERNSNLAKGCSSEQPMGRPSFMATWSWMSNSLVSQWCGVLVVKNPPGDGLLHVPGVLGMNIRRCYRELFGQHDYALFILPSVSRAPEPVAKAFQRCHLTKTGPAK